jgi:hypothetical protein
MVIPAGRAVAVWILIILGTAAEPNAVRKPSVIVIVAVPLPPVKALRVTGEVITKLLIGRAWALITRTVV